MWTSYTTVQKCFHSARQSIQNNFTTWKCKASVTILCNSYYSVYLEFSQPYSLKITNLRSILYYGLGKKWRQGLEFFPGK